MRVSCALLALLLALLCAPARGDEGTPLLSVDDLLSISESYDAFLHELEDLIVERGLLSEEERDAWHDAQLGDYFQNGIYGSILTNFMPGMLGFFREEETLLVLRTPLDGGLTLELSTMRRYTPLDTALPGLMLTLRLEDANGAPVDALFTLSATSGLFLMWDAMQAIYRSVGVSVQSDGETVVWGDQPPAEHARGPVLTIDIANAQTGEAYPSCRLSLTVDGAGFVVTDDALSPLP